MGHIFQMKPNIKMTFVTKTGWTLLLLVLLLAPIPGTLQAAVGEYEFEQKNKAEEKKKSIQRLERDKRKVELAIETTKTLIDRSRQRPYLPELYLRLAELYIEKSRIVFLLRKSQQTGKNTALNQLESNSLKKQAVEIYQRILDHFPDFADRDKVYFFMAHEYGELRQLEDMVKQYRILIAKHKDSQYVPEAYLLLGDYFFSKQNLPQAQNHYQAVLNYPDSSASIIARYKLGWCYINVADYKNALKLFEEAVTTSKGDKEVDIDTYRHVNVRLEALIDMAFCYPEVYKKNSTPDKAMDYFQKYAWSRQSYTTVLEKLAGRYYVKKKWYPAAALYRQLAELRHDPALLIEYAANIYECVQALGTYKDIDQDVKLIVKALEQQKYSVHVADDEKTKNLKDFELYARDVITHLHDKARKKKSQNDFEQASAAYKLYLDFFMQSPVKTEMQTNYAEALFASQQYLEAGKQYEKLAQHDARQSNKEEGKLYSAVISYYQAIKNKDNLNYYELAWAREGLRTVGKQYVAAFPNSRRTSDVRFNVAWIAYDAGNLDEAIAEFSQFTKSYPSGRASKAAVHLILDAYYQKEDFKGLAEYGRQIMSSGRIKDPKFKQEVAQIVQGAESKIVSSLTVSAVDDWNQGKSGLIELANEGATAGVSEQALGALIVASKDKNDLDTLFMAGTSLVAKFPTSSQVENTLNLMIDTSLQTYQYRLLADHLESFCRIMPRHKNAQDFLHQAAQIRQNLGQYQKANANYRQLLSRNPRKAKLRDEIVFAMAANAEHRGQWETAMRTLGDNYKLLSKNARVRARARMADLYLQSGSAKKARRYRQEALKAFKPQKAKTDIPLKDAMAQMEYNYLQSSHQRYLKLQLKNRLDDKIVSAKKKQLETLEKNYQRVLKYQSPPWTLRACYRLAEINREFARFLKESPLPALSAEQKKQYIQILNQKARQYSDKAEKYYQSCMQLAHKWEICDPRLIGFVSANGVKTDPERTAKSFAGVNRSVEIAAQSLKDPTLKKLHNQLIRQPDNMQPFLALADSYLQKGDYRQAALVAQNALSKAHRKNSDVISQIHNTLGVSWLYLGEDEFARDAFKQALEQNTANAAARINLAGLYHYYGHDGKADQLYRQIAGKDTKDSIKGQIHPRAGDMYYADHKISKN
jgi:tetratricopeptide (TPR) repeat protein